MGDRELPRAEDGLAPDRPVTREWGAPDGRPLIFWPGLNPWGSLQLVEVGPLLAERGFRVIAIAPPGMGETPPFADPDAYLPTRLAQTVLDVADGSGIDRFVFMGHSWGGSIGVHLAAMHLERVEALILLDAGYSDVETGESRDELVRSFEADQREFAFESWDAYFAWVRERVRDWRPTLEPRYRDGMTERDGKIVARASAWAGAWALHGVATEPPRSTHVRLSVPVLLILAADAEPEGFAERVPQAVVERVDSGHDIVEDAPEETVRLVANWLGLG
jgi:pimeloyl-ACP methyl ester carboxylesterase